MVDTRTLLAAVLGVGLGLLFLAYPGAVARTHTVGRVPGDRGEYGTGSVPDRQRRIVRALGVGLVAIGAYFGATLL